MAAKIEIHGSIVVAGAEFVGNDIALLIGEKIPEFEFASDDHSITVVRNDGANAWHFYGPMALATALREVRNIRRYEWLR